MRFTALRRLLAALLLSVSAAAGAADLQAQIAAQLSAQPLTRGRFAQEKTLPFLSRPLQSSGEFLYSAEFGVLWRVQEPVASELVITDAGLFQNGERLAGGAGPMGTVKDVFQGLLGGRLAALQRYFTLVAGGDPQHWQLQLTPKPGPLQQALTAVELRGGSALDSLALTEPGGARTRIIFSAIEHPAALTDSERREFADAR